MKMMHTDMMIWECLGASLGLDTAAVAGSTRTFYRHRQTGELCYRKGFWRNLGFYNAGDGIGIDITGPGDWEANDKRYPASEF